MATEAVKICNRCEEENLAWASYCRSCQAPLDSAPLGMARRPMRLPSGLLFSLLLCAMAFVALFAMMPGGVGSNTTTPQLKVLWHKFYGASDQEYIVGEVMNESQQTLDQVTVFGDFYNDDNQIVLSTSAPLDVPMLKPGQKSHFEVTAPYNSEIEKSWFHFRNPVGEIAFQRQPAG